MDELAHCRLGQGSLGKNRKTSVTYDAISTLLLLFFVSTVVLQWSTMILRKLCAVFCLTLLWLFPTVHASLGDRLPDFRQCVSVNNNANLHEDMES